MRTRKIPDCCWIIAAGLILAAGCFVSFGHADTLPDNTEDAAVEKGEVVTLFVDAEGDIYWDGEGIDTNTLAVRLSLLENHDAVALYTDVDESALRPQNRGIMETVLRKGIPLVLVEDESRLRLPMQAGDGQARPLTLSTVRIRQALDLYDRSAGRQDRSLPLSGTDVVLRFDPSDEQGYLLRRVEVGLGGSALWIVHESLSERESATSIQLKREW